MRDEQIIQWWADNPLRKFSDERRIGPNILCSRLGISATTFTYWTRGMYRPRINALERLAKFMGRDANELRDEWTVWLACRPATLYNHVVGGD